MTFEDGDDRETKLEVQRLASIDAKARADFEAYELARLEKEDPAAAKLTDYQLLVGLLGFLLKLRTGIGIEDPFATKEQREGAITRARDQKAMTAKALADFVGVDYRDLRAWVRDRGVQLAKGRSKKVEKIEKALFSI